MTGGAKRVLWVLRHHPEGISADDIARDIGIGRQAVYARIREIRTELADTWYVDVDRESQPIAPGCEMIYRGTYYVLRKRDGVDNTLAQAALA